MVKDRVMGYKNEKWRDAPSHCVECDMLRPHNSGCVCENCHNISILNSFGDWIENPQLSQIYYALNKIDELTV